MEAVLPMELRKADAAKLVETLRTLDAAKVDVVVSASKVRAQAGRILISEIVTPHGVGADLEISDRFVGGLAAKLDIPGTYLRKLLDDTLAREIVDTVGGGHIYNRAPIFDQNVNFWLERAAELERTLLIRSYVMPDGGGYARALLSDRFRMIDNIDMVRAVHQGVAESGVEAELWSADLSETWMHLTYRCPGVAVDGGPFTRNYSLRERGGHEFLSGNDRPLVFAGFRVRNSETGAAQAEFLPVLQVQVCTNGLTRNVAGECHKIRHIGARMEEGYVSERTEAAWLELMVSDMADKVAEATSVEYVQRVMDEINGIASTPIADTAKAIEYVGELFKLPQQGRDDILNAFAAAGRPTVGNLVHAMTDVATQATTGDAQHELECQAETVFAHAKALAKLGA
jgi:hypothetical protein